MFAVGRRHRPPQDGPRQPGLRPPSLHQVQPTPDALRQFGENLPGPGESAPAGQVRARPRTRRPGDIRERGRAKAARADGQVRREHARRRARGPGNAHLLGPVLAGQLRQ